MSLDGIETLAGLGEATLLQEVVSEGLRVLRRRSGDTSARRTERERRSVATTTSGGRLIVRPGGWFYPGSAPRDLIIP